MAPGRQPRVPGAPSRVPGTWQPWQWYLSGTVTAPSCTRWSLCSLAKLKNVPKSEFFFCLRRLYLRGGLKQPRRSSPHQGRSARILNTAYIHCILCLKVGLNHAVRTKKYLSHCCYRLMARPSVRRPRFYQRGSHRQLIPWSVTEPQKQSPIFLKHASNCVSYRLLFFGTELGNLNRAAGAQQTNAQFGAEVGAEVGAHFTPVPGPVLAPFY